MSLQAKDIAVGDRVVNKTFPPISRHTLALYCGASGDHNPIHVDLDFAKKAGFDDVFAHGMLVMASTDVRRRCRRVVRSDGRKTSAAFPYCQE